MTKRTKSLIVLVLLAMGTDFALDRIIVQRLNRGDFVPVRRRIELEKGFQLTQVFTVNYAADYEVGLECKRALPHDDHDGLLQPNLNLTYAVFENESLLIRVDSTNLLHGGAYTDDRITRMLGGFPASPGREYRVDILVRNSIPCLPPQNRHSRFGSTQSLERQSVTVRQFRLFWPGSWWTASASCSPCA